MLAERALADEYGESLMLLTHQKTFHSEAKAKSPSGRRPSSEPNGVVVEGPKDSESELLQTILGAILCNTYRKDEVVVPYHFGLSPLLTE